MDDDDMMHRHLQAPACQSHHGRSFLFLFLFLFTFLAGAIIIYCIVITTTSSSTDKFKVMMMKNKKKKTNAPLPPGRGWCWSVVETVSFMAANSSGRGFYSFVEARRRRHGGSPCFRTSLFGATHVFVSSPSAATSLLSPAAGDPTASYFSKRYVRTVAELLGEHSLLCAPSSTAGGAHRALRRAVAPLFAGARATAPSLAARFDKLACSLITRDWAAAGGGGGGGGVVVVLDGVLDVTFEAICDMLIGGGRTATAALRRDDVRRRLQSDVEAVTRAMLAVPLRMPGTRFHEGLRARKRIMEVLREEIASREGRMDEEEEDDDGHLQQGKHDDDDDDFLQSLLRRRRRRRQQQQQSPSSDHFNDEVDDDGGVLLTDDQILDNILTLIIAGQVTTASAITWMVKYLADNKDFQETLRSVQLELALKQQQAEAPLTLLQHLNSMDLAYMTVKESLRMASIVSWFPRVALEDCQVAGFHIKKGWIVNIDARALHYDATLYDNPTVFDPLRFKGEDITRKQQQSFLVFGAGGRTCLGMNLAKIMMLIFLHHLVTTWRWEMADDDPSLEKWAMFPRLKSGCPIRLTPIVSSAGSGNATEAKGHHACHEPMMHSWH